MAYRNGSHQECGQARRGAKKKMRDVLQEARVREILLSGRRHARARPREDVSIYLGTRSRRINDSGAGNLKPARLSPGSESYQPKEMSENDCYISSSPTNCSFLEEAIIQQLCESRCYDGKICRKALSM